MPFGRRLRAFAGDTRANIVMSFALALPVMVGAAGLAVDYTTAASARSALQSAADGAALAAASELRLAGSNTDAVIEVARRHVEAQLGAGSGVAFEGRLSEDRRGITIALGRSTDTFLLDMVASGATELSVLAEAKIFGGGPLCMIGLNNSAAATVEVDQSRLTATTCAIYANSTSERALVERRTGRIEAKFICSSGGADGVNFEPHPQLDCPQMPDPLAARPAPAVGACDYTKKQYMFGIVVIPPGVYCGGLKISGAVAATFLPGTFVIKDGPFEIGGTSIVTGLGVGFYLTGSNATFDFGPATVINLTAPVDGPLAGMLFFEDRANAPGEHKMNSRSAPVLLGTFYLPKSALHVGAPGGPGLLKSLVGELSAWTIVVADQVSINDGLHLKLNTNYNGSEVPVPPGVGPDGSTVILTQ